MTENYCTGYQKESTFLTYIGVSKKEMAKKLMKQMKALKAKENKGKLKLG